MTTRIASVAICMLILTQCGCTEYHIASPDHELILARGVAQEAGRRAIANSYALNQHRQFSIIGVPGLYEIFFFMPAGLLFLDEKKFQSRVSSDMNRVAFVARRSTEDFWIGFLTYGVVKSMTVGIYTGLRPSKHGK